MISLSSDYTKNIQVFYDSLFHVTKVDKHDILTIYKLDFNYDLAELNQKNIPLTIDWGNSNSTSPNNATRSCYADSIFLEKEKAVLICGLEWISSNLSQSIDGQTHVGDVYNPLIYKYDLNSHTLKKLYPFDEDLEQWTAFLQGDKVTGQTPLISFDQKNNRLGFIFKTNRTVNSVIQRNYIDVDFIYRKDSLELENVRILSAENSNGDYNSTIIFQKYINHDGQKILIAAGSKSGKKKILVFKLKPSTNGTITPVEPDIYLLTEDGFRLLTEDGQYLTIE